jgi:hypothetical protein
MPHHRVAKRLLATFLLVGSLLVGVAAPATGAATPPPPPVLALTTAPPPPGFCDVTFCFVFGAGGFSLAGAVQPPLIAPSALSLKLAVS